MAATKNPGQDNNPAPKEFKRPKADGINSFNLLDHVDKANEALKGNRQLKSRLETIPEGDKGRWRVSVHSEDDETVLSDTVEELHCSVIQQSDVKTERTFRIINGIDYPDYELVSSAVLGTTMKVIYQWVEHDNSVICIGTRIEEVVK